MQLNEVLPVILDTDIGSNLDDALALWYLLRQPRCELVGITTVTGDPHVRAALADAVCRSQGRHAVPIHVGYADPIAGKTLQPQVAHRSILEQWEHRRFEPHPTAVGFMSEAIHARPNAITLLAIGPLTNVARLFQSDPDAARLLKRVVLMGGRYFTRAEDGYPMEWNVQCDPDAADIVFRAPVQQLDAVGLDVTSSCVISQGEWERRLSRTEYDASPLTEMAEVWFRSSDRITLHDPLAACVVFDRSVCRWDSRVVTVDLTSAHARGLTLVDPDPSIPHHIAVEGDPSGPRCQVARDVDQGDFFNDYFEVLNSI